MPFGAMRPDGVGPIQPSVNVPPGTQQSTTGQHKLRVEPSAIPDAKKVFADALNKLSLKLASAQQALQQQVWAGDPVSQATAQKFNNRTFTEANSALTALTSYQTQLQGVVDNLQKMEDEYRRVEGDNAALWGKRA